MGLSQRYRIVDEVGHAYQLQRVLYFYRPSYLHYIASYYGMSKENTKCL